MSTNEPTKAKKASETKEAKQKAAYVDALERELKKAKSYGKPPERIKAIETELAKHKPATKTIKKDA